MTTVIDATGTPVPVYNRSGTTVSDETFSIVGGQPPYQLTQYSQRTFLNLPANPTPGLGNRILILPDNADAGDELWLNPMGGSSAPIVFGPNSEDIIEPGGSLASGGSSGIYFIRISSSYWRRLI